MRRQRAVRHAVIASSVLAWAVACGGSSGSGLIDGPVSEGNAASVSAKRLCAAWRKCDCGKLAGVQLTNCEQGMQFAFDAFHEDAQALGLTFDGDCLARKINAMVKRGCAPLDPFQGGAGCGDEPCAIYTGTATEGDPCDGSPGQSECEQGLVCLGTCEQPCSFGGVLDEGDACVDDAGSVVGACRPPLLCDVTGSGRCRTLPGDGEPCLQSQCSEGHYCETATGEPTCRPTRAGGEPCDVPNECASRECAGGVCTTLPGAGEPCVENFACAEGLACADGTCVEAPGEDEPCLTSGTRVQCAPGLVCGAKPCSAVPKAPECQSCEDPEGFCIARVCTIEPPAVCADSGGLLF